MLVFVRAEQVHLYGNGLVGLEIQSRPLERDERKLLQSLFPHSMDQCEELLAKEALLTAMEVEVGQWPEDKEKFETYETRSKPNLPMGKAK